MQTRRILLSIGLCLAHTGCSMYEAGVRNVTIQPATEIDRKMELRRNEILGEAAWDQLVAEDPDHARSDDYRCGFIAGYSDYLFLGGKGEPPPVPPFHYWTLHYQTPLGVQASHDWFMGFRHGAAVARQSGLREFITIPLSVRYPGDPYRRSASASPAGAEAESLPTLPMPQKWTPAPEPPPMPPATQRPVQPAATEPTAVAPENAAETFALTRTAGSSQPEAGIFSGIRRLIGRVSADDVPEQPRRR